METQVKVDSDRVIAGHPVPGTRSIEYSFSITKDGQTLVSGRSTATKSGNEPAQLSLSDLQKQVSDSYYRKALIVRIKHLLNS